MHQSSWICSFGLLQYIRNSQTGYALDPRADKMMTARDNASKFKAMRYLENNIGMQGSMKQVYYPDLYAAEGNNPYTRDNGYIALMTTEELLFIKAEAQYWKGDKQGALCHTKEAVREEHGSLWSGSIKAIMNKNDMTSFFEVRLPGAKHINHCRPYATEICGKCIYNQNNGLICAATLLK